MKITPFVQKGFPMDSNNSNKFNLINLNSKTEEHIRSLYISNISETFLCLICWQINIIVRAYLNKVQWFNCQWQLADQFKISCKFYYPIYLETYFFYSCILYLIPNNFRKEIRFSDAFVSSKTMFLCTQDSYLEYYL